MTRVMTGKTYKTCGDMMKAKAKAFGANGNYCLEIPLAKRQVKRMMQTMTFESDSGELAEEEKYFAPGTYPVWPPEYDSVCRWLGNSKGNGLVLAGAHGKGKTMLARTIIPTLVELWYGRRMAFCHATEMRARERELADARLLVIDELGAEDPIKTEYGNRYPLFPKVVDAMERRGGLLVVTTNLTPPKMRERYGARTYERLERMADRVELHGDTLRNRHTEDNIQPPEHDAWTRAGKEYAARRNRMETRLGMSAKEYSRRLHLWYEDMAAERGKEVPDWLGTDAADLDYLKTLWEGDRKAGLSHNFGNWIHAKGLWRKEFAKEFGVGDGEQYTPALPISPRSAGVSGGGRYK